MISVRFSTASGFSKETARTIESWPVIVRADGYVIRRPEPGGR